MKKVLIIYAKTNNLKRSGYNNVISAFLNNTTHTNYQEYTDDKACIILKETEPNQVFFHECNNAIFCFSGIYYPPVLPDKDKDPDKQKMDYLASNYFEKGIESFISLKGKFNIIIYDKVSNEIKLINDELGMFPLFIHENKDIIIFCNEYEPLVACIKPELKPDVDSIFEYFIFGAPQNNKTFIKDIRIQAPGTLYESQGNVIKFTKPYKKIRISKNTEHINSIADKYYLLFKEEFNLLLKWNPSFQVTLTGGADSRMLLATMDEEERSNRTFVTWLSPYVADEENQDILIAKMLAKEFGLKHNVVRENKWAIEKIDSNYFRSIKDEPINIISGYLGSETLRFSTLYPFTIPELTRRLISKSPKTYNINHDFIIDLDKTKSNNKALKKSVHFLAKYFTGSLTSHLNVSFKSVYDSINHIKSPYPEIPYTVNYVTRSFFSHHGGGSNSSILMPALISPFLVSPFFSPGLLKIIWGINPKHLTCLEACFTNIIFKQYLSDFCKIESNSVITDFNNPVMPKSVIGKHNINHINVSYDNPTNLFNNEFIKSFEIFNLSKIEEDCFEQKDNNSRKWLDLLQWFFYIESM